MQVMSMPGMQQAPEAQQKPQVQNPAATSLIPGPASDPLYGAPSPVSFPNPTLSTPTQPEPYYPRPYMPPAGPPTQPYSPWAYNWQMTDYYRQSQQPWPAMHPVSNYPQVSPQNYNVSPVASRPPVESEQAAPMPTARKMQPVTDVPAPAESDDPFSSAPVGSNKEEQLVSMFRKLLKSNPTIVNRLPDEAVAELNLLVNDPKGMAKFLTSMAKHTEYGEKVQTKLHQSKIMSFFYNKIVSKLIPPDYQWIANQFVG